MSNRKRKDYIEIELSPRAYSVVSSTGEKTYYNLHDAEEAFYYYNGTEIRVYIRTETLKGYVVLKNRKEKK